MEQFIQAALNTKFYQTKLKGVSLDNWDDIPLTTKQELREVDAYDLLGTDLSNIITYHETSGTTGRPTPSWYSREDMKRSSQLVVEALNLAPGDLVFDRFPFALAIPGFVLHGACDIAGCGHIGIDKASLVTPYLRVMETMVRTRPTIFAGALSEVEILAGVFKRMGVPMHQPRGLWMGGELTHPARIKHIEKLWNAKAAVAYGMTEIGIVLSACEHGHYHLTNPNCKIEVLDDAGVPVGFGVRGNCVVSTTREGMPLLRYANQDLIEIRDGIECGCGDNTPFMIHYGRKEDMVLVDGKDISFYDLLGAVYSTTDVPMLWRVHSYKNRLGFAYQSFDGSICDDHRKRLQRELEEHLGVSVLVQHEELVSEKMLTTKPEYAKYHYLLKHDNE